MSGERRGEKRREERDEGESSNVLLRAMLLPTLDVTTTK